MTGKTRYEAPKLNSWGSITDLTQGMGMTTSSDDFLSCPGESGTSFVGSNDNDGHRCD